MVFVRHQPWFAISPEPSIADLLDETQEDRIVSLHPFLGREDAYLLAVFDGHRGGEASAFCATHLEAAVADCCVGEEGPSMERVLERAMVRLDADFRAAHPDSLAGTTACVAVLCGSTLYVANCGDSRAILGLDAGSQRFDPLLK